MSQFVTLKDTAEFRALIENAKKAPSRNIIVPGGDNMHAHVAEPLSKLWATAVRTDDSLVTSFNQIVTLETAVGLSLDISQLDDKPMRTLETMVAMHQKIKKGENTKIAYGIGVLGSEAMDAMLQTSNLGITLVRSFQMPSALHDVSAEEVRKKTSAIHIEKPVQQHPDIKMGDLIYYTNASRIYAPATSSPPECTVSLFVTEILPPQR